MYKNVLHVKFLFNLDLFLAGTKWGLYVKYVAYHLFIYKCTNSFKDFQVPSKLCIITE